MLREAAALMRSRADGVTHGAQWTGNHYWITDHGQTAMQRLIGGMDSPDDAHYYSSWQPAVALAVADWLESVANLQDFGDSGGPLMQIHALTVARAYLGLTS